MTPLATQPLHREARFGPVHRHLAAGCARAGLLALLAATCLSALSGCRIDIVRLRSGNPIDERKLEGLEVGSTTREQAVEELGAPEKVEWKTDKEYDWYLYVDTVSTGIRFVFPPFRSLLGYQHTFLRLDENSEEVNALQLVFDDRGVLLSKSLRLSEAYGTTTDEASPIRFTVSPYGEYGALLLGDGGFRDYDELFRPGLKAGVDLGVQPFPVLQFILGGNFQRYPGDSVEYEGQQVATDDLEIYQLRIGFRLEIPFEVFLRLGDFDALKRILFEDDPRTARGFRLFILGTTGISFRPAVNVGIDGSAAGSLYKSGYGFSGDASAGVEYAWSWGAAYVGVGYQSVGGFSDGDATLDGDGGSLEALLVGGGLSLRF